MASQVPPFVPLACRLSGLALVIFTLTSNRSPQGFNPEMVALLAVFFTFFIEAAATCEAFSLSSVINLVRRLGVWTYYLGLGFSIFALPRDSNHLARPNYPSGVIQPIGPAGPRVNQPQTVLQPGRPSKTLPATGVNSPRPALPIKAPTASKSGTGPTSGLGVSPPSSPSNSNQSAGNK